MAGLGDDTKQILQKENIDIRYSNSKKDLKWDLLHRNIRQNLVGSHIMAEFAKVPGWKILPLFECALGNSNPLFYKVSAISKIIVSPLFLLLFCNIFHLHISLSSIRFLDFS